MAKATKIVVWFDDDTHYDIDPAGVQSMFLSEGAAAGCGHGPPYQVPGPHSPVHGPFPDHGPPPVANNSGAGNSGDGGVSTMEGSCYYVNGMIICP
jgi:hypothetical protein